jgi:hypothetical protein
MCAKRRWELFSPTLLVKVEVAMLKYRSPLHFLKSSVRRRKESPHVQARSPRLASQGGMGVRHLHEWSTEIWLLALQGCILFLQFLVLVSWSSSLQNCKRFRL